MASSLPLPPIYLLSSHIPLEALHALEDEIPTLTYDINEARLVLGRISTKQRVEFELRCRGCWTEEVVSAKDDTSGSGGRAGAKPIKRSSKESEQDEGPSRKKRKTAGEKKSQGSVKLVTESSTESKDETATSTQSAHGSSPLQKSMNSPLDKETQASNATSVPNQRRIDWGDGDIIKVVKLAWYTDSVAARHLLPLGDYLVYTGRRIPTPKKPAPPQSKPVYAQSHTQKQHEPSSRRSASPTSILSRAKSDSASTTPKPSRFPPSSTSSSSQPTKAPITRPTALLQQTTSDHDATRNLPPLPAWLHDTYSCTRPTPPASPNDAFLTLLKRIKLSRLLHGDDIGVRAYSTSIASLAAYPHTLTQIAEVLRLPGCDQKLAALWKEFSTTGHIHEVDEINGDPDFKVLETFWNIWGVGPATARELYRKGYRDLDDVVEFHWNNLTRVQQIGVKYYDEFAQRIPRDEVERIGATILAAVNAVHRGCEMVIVGGYRRGKPLSGDVDVVISHRDENDMSNLVLPIVEILEDWGFITHTLELSLANSKRGKVPMSLKGGSVAHGPGFDTLDKALVVWQDPNWPTKSEDTAAAEAKAAETKSRTGEEVGVKVKNPNLHHRVDIIVSPWRTAGCAVLGWTGGTTFERDLRRWVAKMKGLKFDSSGVRDRGSGEWLDLESEGGEAKDMVEAEKKVFEGLGLVYREPGERCTG
jgi:DNA polymerase IV